MTTGRVEVRRFLAGMAAAAMLAAPAMAVGVPQVALVMKSLSNPFFKAMTDGAKAHAAQHASQYKLIAVGTDNETDKAGQIKLVEKMIASKVDAIVLAPADSRDLVPLVKKALDAGILVVNIDNKLDDRVLAEAGINVPFVGPSNRAGAHEVGQYLATKLRSGDKVAIVEGISTTTNAKARTEGFREAMSAAGVNVVVVRSGQWEADIARKVVADLLTEFPDVSALLCGNDSMAVGAIGAIQAAGKQGKIMVVGYDNTPAVKPLLADGRLLATEDQFGSQQAVYGIELAVKALADKTDQASLPSMVQTPVKLVTK